MTPDIIKTMINFTTRKPGHDIPASNGVMLEWLKRHAWKACIRQKRIGGSNPPHSATRTRG